MTGPAGANPSGKRNFKGFLAYAVPVAVELGVSVVEPTELAELEFTVSAVLELGAPSVFVELGASSVFVELVELVEPSVFVELVELVGPSVFVVLVVIGVDGSMCLAVFFDSLGVTWAWAVVGLD